MKRILSLFIAVLMVASAMSFAAFTSGAVATVTENTLDANNVGIKVPYFSGTVNYYSISGRATGANSPASNSKQDRGPINYIEKDETKVIDLDGVVTEEEWGLPLLNINKDMAATFDGLVPSAENTFWWHIKDGERDKYNAEQNFGYKVWMAWDEEYLYVAAVVDDPDGPFNNTSIGADVWDADALQLIIDPDGPNSVVNGSRYDASKNFRPWGSIVKARPNTAVDGDPIPEDAPHITKYDGKIANIGISYFKPTDKTNGAPVMFDMAQRYNPIDVTTYLKDDDGNDTDKVAYVTSSWQPYNISNEDWRLNDDLADNPIMGEYYAYAAVLPKYAATEENANHYETTYEVAIPWTLVSGSYFDYETHELVTVDPDPKAGDEYGLSLVVLDAQLGAKKIGKYQSTLNQWLTWGSGVCNYQEDNKEYVTAGGSNSMLLVSDELGTTNHEHVFDAPDCTHPYVCTICGYEKGFVTGHDYVSEMITPLYANQDGLIRSTCTVCGNVVETTVSHNETDTQYSYRFDSTPYYDVNGNTTLLEDHNKEWMTGDDTTGWRHIYRGLTWQVDENDSSKGKWVEGGDVIFNEDGSTKSTYKLIDGQMMFDLTDDSAGTYFYTDHSYANLGHSIDFKLTNDYATYCTNEPEKNYKVGLYYWFGGAMPSTTGYSYGINYAAGFFPTTPGGTVGKFMIVDGKGQVTAREDLKIYAQTEEIDLGNDWHNMTLAFDEEASAAFLYLDGECLLGVWDEGMTMNRNRQQAILRRMDVPMIIKDMAISSQKTEFLKSVDVVEPTGYTVYCDGEAIGTFEEGETVTLPVPTLKIVNNFAARFFTWEGADVVRGSVDGDNDTATGRTYTLVMPASDVELTSKFVVVGDTDGDGIVTAQDVKLIKSILANNDHTALQAEASDFDCDGFTTALDLKAMKALIANNYTVEK